MSQASIEGAVSSCSPSVAAHLYPMRIYQRLSCDISRQSLAYHVYRICLLLGGLIDDFPIAP